MDNGKNFVEANKQRSKFSSEQTQQAQNIDSNEATLLVTMVKRISLITVNPTKSGNDKKRIEENYDFLVLLREDGISTLMRRISSIDAVHPRKDNIIRVLSV